MERNGMPQTDLAKAKFFYFGLGKARKHLERHTLANKMNYNQVLGYVRDYFSSDQAEHVQYAMHPGAGGKFKGDKRKSKKRYNV